jgi:hypothetical protein
LLAKLICPEVFTELEYTAAERDLLSLCVGEGEMVKPSDLVSLYRDDIHVGFGVNPEMEYMMVLDRTLLKASALRNRDASPDPAVGEHALVFRRSRKPDVAWGLPRYDFERVA